jgi:outer membrane protein assembly factor BamB
MRRRRRAWWFAGALVLAAAGAVAWNVARSPLSPYEQFHMLRLGLRAYLQEEPDYALVEASRGKAAPTPQSAHPRPTWTDFRGPGRLGEYTETPIRTDWPAEGLPLVWRRPAGAAYGSLTVAEGLVYSLEQRRDGEALVAYDFDSGAEAWITRWPARFEEPLSGEGPRSTPVWADGVVYALGALGELRACDARGGKELWRADTLALAQADGLLYGSTASPLVRGEHLIAVSGAPRDGGGCLLALARRDGGLAWRAVPDRAAYASPLLAELGGYQQILFAGATRLWGVDPIDGAVLWSFPWQVAQELTCSQPLVIDADHVLLSAGYGKGAALVRVHREQGRWSASEVWKAACFKTRINPPVLHAGLAYGLDEGVLSCIDPRDGRRAWKDGRYGLGQVLLASGHLLVSSEDGALALVAISEGGAEELARFQAIEGLTLNVPAAAHGRILLRNKLEIACFELAPP